MRREALQPVDQEHTDEEKSNTPQTDNTHIYV